MKRYSLAAGHAALSTTVMLLLCLMLPVTGFAAGHIDVHEAYFTDNNYEGTKDCLKCHEKAGQQMLNAGHFKWQGKTDQIVGREGKAHGKNDLINNFCIAVPTNEGRCTQCHVGYGYADKMFDFNNPENLDCLVCHDQSKTYAKDKKTAGMPVPSVDLNVVARSVGKSAKPTRKACLGCHAKAGGGDNVKHGDLSTDLIATTRDNDVHMAVDGLDFACVNCHGANHNPGNGQVNHGMAGMELHHVNEGEMKQCSDCHGERGPIHAGTSVELVFTNGWHGRLACQFCHVPEIARVVPTKTAWYWEDAGMDVDPIPIDPDTGKATYDKMKGTFEWANNVRPTYRWSNGTWNRALINANDKYDSVPIDLGSPAASYTDEDAMIYPFKKMVGNQPVDPVTKTVLVPHLFGKAGGPNPYWVTYEWAGALADGAAYTGQDFSGTYTFEDTEMLLAVNHEVAPAEQAYGMGGIPSGCTDCHGGVKEVEWDKLFWTDDPLNGGMRLNGEVARMPSFDWLK